METYSQTTYEVVTDRTDLPQGLHELFAETTAEKRKNIEIWRGPGNDLLLAILCANRRETLMGKRSLKKGKTRDRETEVYGCASKLCVCM